MSGNDKTIKFPCCSLQQQVHFSLFILHMLYVDTVEVFSWILIDDNRIIGIMSLRI